MTLEHDSWTVLKSHDGSRDSHVTSGAVRSEWDNEAVFVGLIR